MKKALKIFLPVLVIAMLIGALCVFASAEDTVYFTVTDKNGTKTEYKTPYLVDAFPTNNTFENVTVDLLQDVQWVKSDAVAKNLNVKGNVVINLNGKTLTVNGGKSVEGEQGRIGFANNSTTLVVNGPGKYANTASMAKFFHASSDTEAKSGVTFNKVEITAPSMLFDMRFGHINLNDCTLTASGYAICLAGNYNGGYNVVNMVNTTYYYNGTGHAVQTGRPSTSGAAATEFNMVNSHIVAPKAAAVFKNITTLASGSTVDLSKEIHNVTMDANSSIVATKAQLVTSSKDGTAGGVGKHYFGTLTTVEGTVLGYATPGIVITDPTGTQKAYLGAGQYYKLVSKESTDVINVQYILDDVRKPVRLMLKGAELGFATLPAGTPEYNTETKTLVIKDYFNGWKDAEGNIVVNVPTEAPAEGNYVVTLDLADVVPYWATYATSDYTQAPVNYSIDDNNVYGKLSSAAPYLVLFKDSMIWRKDSYVSGYDLGFKLYLNLNGHSFTVQSGAEPKMGQNQKDPNSNTYSSDGGFRGSKTSLDIVGPGTLKTVNTKLAYPSSSSATVSISNCKLELGLLHFIDGRGGDISINNVEIDVLASGQLISPNNNAAAQTMALTMKDVRVYSSNGSTITNLINSPRNIANNINNITLENVKVDAKVTGNVFNVGTGYAGALNVKNLEVVTSENAKLFGMTYATSELKVTVDGLKFSHASNLDNSVIKNAAITAGVGAYNGTNYSYVSSGYETQNWEVFGTKSVQYVLDGVVSSCPIDTVNIPDDQGRPVFYDIKQSWIDSNLVSAVAGNVRSITIDMDALTISENITWAIINKDGVITDRGATAELTKSKFTAIPSGGTLYVLTNIAYTDNTGLNVPDGATVDLCGNTLDLRVGGSNNRLSHYSAGYTVKNGNILIGKGSAAYIDSSSVEVTFENVNFTMTENSLGIIDARNAKKITIKDCTFNGDTDAKAFNLGYRTSTSVIEIDGCTFNTPRFIGIGPVVEYDKKTNEMLMQTLNITVTVKNSTITNSKATSSFADSKSIAPASKLNFTFENVKSTNFNYFNIAKECNNLVTYKSCEFKSMPTVSELTNVSYSDQVIIETTDKALPYKMINAADAPKTLANLTLYTDFVLNFYLPATATNITVNGAAAEATAFDGMLKVACDRVSALEVGNAVTVAYDCTVGGYTVAMSATYSVADYAKAILEGEYDAQAKALVANAVRYSASVFEYTKTRAPEQVAALLTLAGYTENVGALNAVPASTADYSALAEYVESVQLSLGATLKYVVNFKADFEGTVTVNGKDIEVKGSEYIVLRASDFADGLTLTVNGVTGTYDLAAYYAGVKGTDAALDALLVALYNYSAQAKAYVEQ